MLTIRREQLAVFGRPGLEQFEADMLAHLRQFYPVDHALLGPDGLLAVIRAACDEARAIGLDLQGDVRRFVDLRLVLGSGFLRDPLLPWAAACLSRGRATSGTIAELQDQALEYLDLVNGADGSQALRAMLRASRTSLAELTEIPDDDEDHGATFGLMRKLWPQKFRLLPPEQRDEFLDAAALSARMKGFDTPETAQFYTVLMFLLGAEFATDPATPWAAASLAATVGQPAQVRAQALYDAGQEAVAKLLPLLSSER